jgi:hypothetical protein
MRFLPADLNSQQATTRRGVGPLGPDRPGPLGPMPAWIGAALLLGAFSLVASADAPKSVSETRPASATTRVEVENVAGSITITGWDREEVALEGEIDPDATLEFTGSGDNLRIVVKYPRDFGRHHLGIRHEGSVLRVKMPLRGAADVQAVSADVELSCVHGNLEIESVSGKIELDCKSDLGAPSDAGSGAATRRINVSSVSGDVLVEAETEVVRLKVESVSGAQILHLGGGEVEGSSVSGDIKIDGGLFQRLEVSTVSGALDFSGAPAKDGRFEMSSHSGDVTVRLPERVNAEISVDTFSGDIVSDFGGAAERTDEHAPGKEMELTLGSDGARMEVSSFSGSVRLKKQ